MSSNAGQCSVPSRHERRSPNEVVKNLPVVAGTKRFTLFQDSHTSASSWSTRKCAGAAVSSYGSLVAVNVRRSMALTHSMALTTRHYCKGSIYTTKRKTVWRGMSRNAETKSASWCTRSAGSRN